MFCNEYHNTKVDLEFLQGRGGQVVMSLPQDRRIPGSKADSTEDSPCKRIWCKLDLTSCVKHPPAGVVRKLGEGSASSDVVLSYNRDSNLQGFSQNSPRVASKRDVN
ncbi:hypothetical protein AVEN_96430-1, partial [Araneus ventricosus]